MVDFSPCEKYLVTCASELKSGVEAFCVWDINSMKLLRKFDRDRHIINPFTNESSNPENRYN